MPVSEATRAILEARREMLNARFVRMGRGSDGTAFLGYLERTVDPLVENGGGERVLFALFDLGIIGMPRGLVGEREASRFERLIVDELPRFGEHFQRSPAALVTLVANGFERLSRELGEEHAVTWVRTLASVSGLCGTRTELLEAGLMIAWRTGLAEARAAVHALSPRAELVNAIFGVDALDATPRHRFRFPAATTLGPLELLAAVGGFAGFGGPFRVPPLLTQVNGTIYASDGMSSFELFADAFGARLRVALPIAAEAPDGESISVSPTGDVVWTMGDGEVLRGSFPSLSGARSCVAAQGVAAVALPTTHLVFVLGRRARRD